MTGSVGKLSWRVGPNQVCRFALTVVWSSGQKSSKVQASHMQRVGQRVLFNLTTSDSRGWIADALWFRPATVAKRRRAN